MSRVGSKEINIPESVKINLQDGLISAEGPLGKLESKLNSQIEVIIQEFYLLRLHDIQRHSFLIFL